MAVDRPCGALPVAGEDEGEGEGEGRVRIARHVDLRMPCWTDGSLGAAAVGEPAGLDTGEGRRDFG